MEAKYVDLQVNGYRGINFSGSDITLADVLHVGELLAEQGVAAYCPTVITSSLETYRRNLPLIAAAAHQATGSVEAAGGVENTESVKGAGSAKATGITTGIKRAKILGIHLEGPFISPDTGPRGIHQADFVHAPSIELYEELQELCEDSLALITVAPDQPGAIDLIRHINGHSDTVVSIGHHLASQAQITAAVDAGARAATHVGNGLPTMLHRHENPLWPILVEDRLTAFFIGDGFHLPPALLKVLFKTKTPERLILTSDLMHFGGLEPGSYKLGGLDITFEKNGKLHHAGGEQLAGAALPINRCAEYLHTSLGISEEIIHRIAWENPLALLDRSL